MRFIPVSVVDGNLEIDLSYLRKIVIPETPSVPTGLELEDVSAGTVELTWTNTGDASRWDVFRDGVYLATSLTAGYVDSSVQPSTTYDYQIRGNNIFPSGLSTVLEVTTDANSTPAWSLTSQVAFINVPYTLDLDSVCNDQDHHDLTYSIVSGGGGLVLTGSILQNLNPTAVSSTNLTLRANDGFGTSDVTIGFSVRDPDVTAPSVPGSPSATATGSTVTFTWTASTDTNGVSHYRVFRDGVFLNTATSLQYTDSDLANGTYTYSVSAVDGSSNSNESAQGSASPVVVNVLAQFPDTPVNVVATQSPPSSINVSWEEGPGGADPDDYDVQYATAVGGPYTAWPHSGTATSTTITGLSAGTYFIRVRAQSGVNQSSFSAPVSVNLTPVTGADFTITAQTAARTFDGAPSQQNVQPGDIIQLSSGTHGPITFQNVKGTTSERILIRGPATGRATIRSDQPNASNFIVHLVDCINVDIDGISTTTTPDVDGISRNIRVMYATNATAVNKDAPTGWIKLSGDSTSSFTMSRNITIRNVEIDGGWPTRATTGIGIQAQDHSFKEADFPMSQGFWLENLNFDDNYIHHCKAEGLYVGTNPYQAVRTNLPPNQIGAGVSLRNIKFRGNYITDCGGSAINPKSVFGGTPGADGANENSISRNVILRCGIDPAANGAAAISINSSKFDVFGNWIESCARQGVTYNISEGTNVIDPTLTFTSRMYNNVIRLCGTVNAAAAILGAADGSIPSGMQPVIKAFNNTITENNGNGVLYNGNVHPNSWVRNCVIVDNSDTQISDGPGSSSNNDTAGTAEAKFLDSAGTYEAGNVDLNLNAASLASGTVGSGLPHTWVAGVDIAPTDYDGVTRVTPDKGAYEL